MRSKIKNKPLITYFFDSQGVFVIAGLSKITGLKSKKLQHSVSFLFFIHVTNKKSTTYAKF